jgi:hypothetical protein
MRSFAKSGRIFYALTVRPQFGQALFSSRSFDPSALTSEIRPANRRVLQFRQQFGQSVEIGPKSLQLQFGQKCDGNSARNNSPTGTIILSAMLVDALKESSWIG